MNSQNLAFIYYLKNPSTGEIFYVGATKCSLSNRLRTHYQHLREYERGIRQENNRYIYLKNLRPLKAEIGLLEIITDLSLLDSREIFFVKKFREINPNLTNMIDGGRGRYTSKYYTEGKKLEYRQKMSKANKGKKKPEGFAENLSISRMGINNPACKPIKNEGIIITNNRINFYYFKYGFEVNNFFRSKSAYSNILKTCLKNGVYSKKPYGYECKFFNEASKRVQDIVQSQYENIE